MRLAICTTMQTEHAVRHRSCSPISRLELALTNANFVVEDPLFNSGPDMPKGNADVSAMLDFVIP